MVGEGKKLLHVRKKKKNKRNLFEKSPLNKQ